MQDREAVEKLVEATFFGPCQVAKKAPVIIVICARPGDDVSYDGRDYYLFDVGLAVQNMLLAATDQGLVTHPLVSYDEDGVKKMLGIPSDYRVLLATPLAYPDGASYDDVATERLTQRSRKELKEIAFVNRWE